MTCWLPGSVRLTVYCAPEGLLGGRFVKHQGPDLWAGRYGSQTQIDVHASGQKNKTGENKWGAVNFAPHMAGPDDCKLKYTVKDWQDLRVVMCLDWTAVFT